MATLKAFPPFRKCDRAPYAATLCLPLPWLVLLTAYLMREILMLLYVSALFAVVFTPLIRGIMRLTSCAGIPAAGWRSFSCC